MFRRALVPILLLPMLMGLPLTALQAAESSAAPGQSQLARIAPDGGVSGQSVDRLHSLGAGHGTSQPWGLARRIVAEKAPRERSERSTAADPTVSLADLVADIAWRRNTVQRLAASQP